MSKKIYIIAGEPSGDRLGATVLKALKDSGEDIEIRGIGGPDMMKNGLPGSLFPIDELSVMGLWEVLARLPRLLWRFRQTLQDIKNFAPDILLTVDAPDFSFRVHKALQKDGTFKTSHQHLVAPTVWAWRPERAEKCARLLDRLYCLFPFEPPYFTKHGLDAVFCGHPVTQSLHPVARANEVLGRLGIRGGPIVALLFGSRQGELDRMGGQIVEAAQLLTLNYPNISFVIPTLPVRQEQVAGLARQIPAPSHILTAYEDKHMAMASCDAAIAISGTIGLELSMLQIPHIITYRFAGISWMFLKNMFRTDFAHLSNITLGRRVVPELLQYDCRADMLATSLTDLLSDPAAQEAQREAFAEVRQRLVSPDDKGMGHFIAQKMLQSA